MTSLSNPYSVPISRLVSTQAFPPGSKSITNRVLLLAALAKGETQLTGVLDAEDARIMIEALKTLGVDIEFDAEAHTARVSGIGGKFPVKSAELWVGNSGTTARFLTAALVFSESGEYRLDGIPRMRQRPMRDLLNALKALGRDVASENNDDCIPLIIRGRSLDAGNGVKEVQIAADASSQFLSGLLMAAPLAQKPLTIAIDGALASRPYVEMTLEIIRSFGVDARADEEFRRFDRFDQGSYQGLNYAIEPDASTASYFFALPAVLGGEMTIKGLSRQSLQGDVAFVDCLEQMGCNVEWRTNEIKVARDLDAPLRGIDVDLNAHSDVAQTLGVVACFANSPTTIRNVSNMRLKETDRISAFVTEARKLGVRVEEYDDGMKIDPVDATLRGATIATYNDHRMAMSFALAGLRIPDVKIENPECVGKTYPGFWKDLARVTSPIETN